MGLENHEKPKIENLCQLSVPIIHGIYRTWFCYNDPMSKLSFNAFCIEMYAERSGLPSPKVFGMFRDSGLLEMLGDDYEDLHGMSWEYLMGMFDDYLRERTYA
jgi:hypothetical protein